MIFNKIFYFILLAGFFAAGFLLYNYRTTIIVLNNNASASIASTSSMPRVKPARQTVKAVYLTAYSAGQKNKMDEIINLLNKTELNAVVIDIKDYSGKILYDSKLDLVNEIKASGNRMGDVRALIKKLHRNNIYVIARQTVFQDPWLARNKSDWAIKTKYGGIWYDNKGLSWVDPTRAEVWEYNLAIAKEAIDLGFDEINFDYMRFPSDGNLSIVKYNIGDKKKYEVMGEFYKFLSDGLKDEPALISIDVFGLVMEHKAEEDMNIGQRLADAVENFDYVCPMMYPSHYPSGHLGLANPAANPGIVIAHGMKLGLPWFHGKRAEVRPWLQAFNMGAVYDGSRIRAEINEVEKKSNAGWLLWNASNRYTAAGLMAE